jgi:O-methyltransferase domain
MDAEKSDASPVGTSSNTRWLQGIQEAFFTQRCLHAAARLGVADALSSGPLDVDALAQRIGADPGSLYRILRFLASQGVFVESAPRVFGLTPRAECLRSDEPNSARWLFAHDLMGRASAEIVHSVRTGTSAFEKMFGEPLWDYLAAHPDENDWFNRHMQSQAAPLAMTAIEAYDWSRSRIVVDVGGGTGRFLGGLLQKQPHLSGILVDLPHVVASAGAVLQEAGVSKRCRIVAGNFFEGVVAEGDTYVLSRILHDWDDEKALRILRTVRKSMPAKARLLILEMLVPEGGKPHISKVLDIAMMMLFGGGRERTEKEFAELVREASFEAPAVIPTSGPTWVIEAIAA